MQKVEEVCGEVMQVVGDMPTYVTFDVDALDPSFALGTGSPEVRKKCYQDFTDYRILPLLFGVWCVIFGLHHRLIKSKFKL